MKSLIAILCLVGFAAMGIEANRAKRFAGFGTFSTVGGRVGCVVSENSPGNSSLYINSHFSKFLSEDEQQELDQYKEKLAQFKTDVKAYLEERQKQALEGRNQFRQGGVSGFSGRNNGFGPNTGGRGQIADEASSSPSTAASGNDENRTTQSAGTTGPSGSLKQPEPPKKPSFCSEKSTTQYVFDGCSVQGDNVYIGDNFVRKLTPKEQDELEQFDKQFTAYQKAVTSNFKQQVQDIFGKNFGSLFETSSSSAKASPEASAVEPSGEGGASSSSAAPQQLEAPKTPNFCTLIV